jgi:hypothetical protein
MIKATNGCAPVDASRSRTVLSELQVATGQYDGSIVPSGRSLCVVVL